MLSQKKEIKLTKRFCHSKNIMNRIAMETQSDAKRRRIAVEPLNLSTSGLNCGLCTEWIKQSDSLKISAELQANLVLSHDHKGLNCHMFPQQFIVHKVCLFLLKNLFAKEYFYQDRHAHFRFC